MTRAVYCLLVPYPDLSAAAKLYLLSGIDKYRFCQNNQNILPINFLIKFTANSSSLTTTIITPLVILRTFSLMLVSPWEWIGRTFPLMLVSTLGGQAAFSV